jgi:hypothetical protein
VALSMLTTVVVYFFFGLITSIYTLISVIHIAKDRGYIVASEELFGLPFEDTASGRTFKHGYITKFSFYFIPCLRNFLLWPIALFESLIGAEEKK